MMASTSYRVVRQASLFANPARVLRPSHVCRAGLNESVRHIHRTPIVLKKNDDGDLFGDQGDLFSNSEASPSSSSSPKPIPKKLLNPGVSKKLSPEEKTVRYNKLMDSLIPFLTKLAPPPKNPTSLADPKKDPAYHEQQHLRKQIKPVRHTVWKHLIDLAQTEEELSKVAELFGKWRDFGKVFRGDFGEHFVSRCANLKCPQLALKVFGNHAKYPVPLTLPAARHLLYSLHETNSLPDILTASALFHVYNLPPVAADITSCAIVVDAALINAFEQQKAQAASSGETTEATEFKKSKSIPSLEVARGLLPSLQTMLQKSKPRAWKIPRTAQHRAMIIKTTKGKGKKRVVEKTYNREKVWVASCLAKIQAFLARKTNELGDGEWLRQWRIRERHLKMKEENRRLRDEAETERMIAASA